MPRTPSEHRLVADSEDHRESIWMTLMMCQRQSHRVREVLREDREMRRQVQRRRR